MDEDIEDPRNTSFAASDEDEEIEAVDYRFLSSSVQKKDYVLPARGEKDFEPDGTNRQDKILQSSRDAMYDAVRVERELSHKNYIRATWHSDLAMGKLDSRDAKGTMFKSIGRTDRHQQTWLLPEELLYMVERGNLECFYEQVELPMSLQAAYAECIPHIGLEKFQVYAYLKRAGYMVLRSIPPRPTTQPQETSTLSWITTLGLPNLLHRLHSLLWSTVYREPKTGFLNRTHIYRGYPEVYRRLALVQCHTFSPPTGSSHSSPSHIIPTPNPRENPLQMTFDLWKPNTHFRKSDPGEPHFRVTVLDSQNQHLPDLPDLNHLFDSIPLTDQTDMSDNPIARLKSGFRNVVLAIVDMGVISFLSLGDVSFHDDPIYPQHTTHKPARSRPARTRKSR